MDPIQKLALSRSVQLEAVYLEALLYSKAGVHTQVGQYVKIIKAEPASDLVMVSFLSVQVQIVQCVMPQGFLPVVAKQLREGPASLEGLTAFQILLSAVDFRKVKYRKTKIPKSDICTEKPKSIKNEK